MSNADSQRKVIEVADFVAAAPTMDADEALRRYARLIVFEDERPSEGATSVVMRAVNAAGEVMALKVLRPARGSADGDALSRARERAFHEEYINQLMVSRLRGFPEVYGYGSAEGRPAIVMEWVEGTSLHDVEAAQRHAPWSGELVARLGVAVLDILCSTSALDAGFVHRDISARNVILRSSERPVADQLLEASFDVCLVDMGSAVSVSPADGSFTMLADVWRNGTPDYAPPEMLTRDVPGIDVLRHSGAIDVYALCSVLYELYAGSTPFRVSEHPEASPYRLKMDSSPAPLAARTDLDRGLCHLVMAGIEREPGARPTAPSLRAALRGWLAGEADPSRLLVPCGPVAAPRPEQPAEKDAGPQPRSVSRRGLVVGAAAGVAAVAGLGAAAWATGGFGILRRPRGLAGLGWDDLSEVSAEIAAAGSEGEAVEVARGYGLCDEAGAIDLTQSKPLTVAGEEMSAQLAGIAHDVRADGSPIGLSFLLTEMLPEQRSMSERGYMGGWEDSELRAWLNDVLLGDLPEELARNIVAAGKLSNNAGAAKSADDVTSTEDFLWVPSYVELVGERARSSFSDGFQYLADVLNAEGSQYKLFRDQGIYPLESRQELVRARGGEADYWWLRTASPDVSESEGMAFFNRTGPNGDPFHFATACTDPSGILLGFCI